MAAEIADILIRSAAVDLVVLYAAVLDGTALGKLARIAKARNVAVLVVHPTDAQIVLAYLKRQAAAKV